MGNFFGIGAPELVALRMFTSEHDPDVLPVFTSEHDPDVLPVFTSEHLLDWLRRQSPLP
ncbi:MAG: hypothetical protein MJE77_29955 [Proteobacteria bacterium]|nr:hypothetical protein [Pseudomonadota bacterium]